MEKDDREKEGVSARLVAARAVDLFSFPWKSPGLWCCGACPQLEGACPQLDGACPQLDALSGRAPAQKPTNSWPLE